jgi:predicted dinucleotide-binding enzyme
MKRAAMLQYGTFLADGLVIFLNVPYYKSSYIDKQTTDDVEGKILLNPISIFT